jgi:hypothetical protein
LLRSMDWIKDTARLAALDSIPSDSIQPTLPSFDPLADIRLSKDSLDAPIEYTAEDSMVYDLKNQIIYLYGNAQVNYTTIELKAAIIEFDWNTNTVTAKGRKVLGGRTIGAPQFSDGDQQFTAREMRYNFKTKKGVIFDARTTQNNLYVLGERAKFMQTGEDSLRRDVIYSANGTFTTCDNHKPHYGVVSGKQKVIANELVVVGPSNLEIMGVPTPLWLPFGFFPMSEGRSTGLMFPRDFEYSDNWGFGLRNVGWYFPINDNLDLQLTADIYLKGSYRLRALSQYTKRYRYNGNLRFEFASLRDEDAQANYIRNQSLILQWSHNQDSKAHPSRSIGGNINIQTNNALSRNYNDAESVQRTSLGSNFNYRESFPNQPYNLAIGLTHSQNTQTRKVTVNFPTVNFRTQTLYPFKNKKGGVGGERWYEKVALTYRGEAKAQVVATDTTLFTQETLDEIEFGARHNISTNASFKALKYFNINPRVNYDEVWYFESLQKTFNSDVEILYDTLETDEGVFITPIDTIFGSVEDTTVFGFKPLRKFEVGVSMDTKLFGTILLKNRLGPLKGLRHVVTPSVGFSFEPDYTNPRWGYFDQVQEDTRFPEELLQYSTFGAGLYSGDRPSEVGRRMSFTYGISSFVEAKLFSKRDSSFNNVRLLRRLDINGSYNFAAEEFKFSRIRVSANSSLFKGIVSMVFSANFDPYAIDEEGERINTLLWDRERKIARFEDARLSVTTSLTVRKLKSLFQSDKDEDSTEEAPRAPGQRAPQKEDLLSWFETFSIRHNFVLQGQSDLGRDTFFVAANVVSLNGSVPLTKNWRMTVGSFGYDFSKKQFTFPSFSVSRDLHCWDMGFSWQPSRGTYSFYLRVDQGSVFDFINIPYQKGNQDAIFSQGGFSGF